MFWSVMLLTEGDHKQLTVLSEPEDENSEFLYFLMSQNTQAPAFVYS